MTEEMRPAVAAVISQFFAASALLDPVRMRIWDGEGLTVTQLRLLFFLSDKEGVGNAELADRLLVTRPSISALLDRLERAGFIRREASESDRRSIRIWLEPKGQEVISHLRVELREYAASLVEDLGDADLQKIDEALQVLVEAGRAARRRQLERES